MINAIDVYTLAPRASSSVAVATAASAFVSVAGSRRVWIKASVDAHINFGATDGATVVTTTNIYVTAGQDYPFDLSGAADAGFKVKLRSGSPGVVYYAAV